MAYFWIRSCVRSGLRVGARLAVSFLVALALLVQGGARAESRVPACLAENAPCQQEDDAECHQGDALCAHRADPAGKRTSFPAAGRRPLSRSIARTRASVGLARLAIAISNTPTPMRC
jgi:hypothetical protein